MKTLIIFMSYHGAARKVAADIQQNLGLENTVVAELEKETIPELKDFDTVVIGGSIHMGKIQKQIRAYCVAHLAELLQKRLGLYICYKNIAKGQIEFDDAFPAELRNHAVAHGLFSGEQQPEKMNFIEKLMNQTVDSATESDSALEKAQISRFEADTRR